MDKRTLTFSLPTGQKTIKLFTLHPKKPWVAIVTHYNTFSLWNYQQKILIRSFNCNTLDETGNVDIKDLVFYDKHCLCYQNESLGNMKNNIIFSTNFKIFFYDYITDGIKQINQTEIQKKNIKKISPYSQSKICIGLSDGSLKLYDNRDSSKNSMTIKTIRGYHTRPITHLFTYCQSVNESPRVISVSASDGLMACWNIETILSNPNHYEICNPSFKLQSPTQSKSQEIRSLQYDKETYKLLTLTENHLSIWNTMTGLELKRIRCDFRLKEIYFFNHFSYGPNTFVGFSEGSIIQIIKISPTTGKLTIVDDINLRNMIKQTQLVSVRHIFNWASSPSQLFVQTESGLLAIEINVSYRPCYGFNNSFVTRLSTLNSKDFVIKGKNQNRINMDITMSQGRNARFEEGILFNTFYLSLEEDWVCFNLVEIQTQNMFHQKKKYKFFKLDPSSLLSLSEGPQSIVEVSYDGKFLIIFSRSLFYYEIYSVIQGQENGNLLDIHESASSIEFYSKFQLVTRGASRDIIWHQYKNQFAAICPFDKNGELVTFQKDKEKKGIFSRPSKEEYNIYYQRKPVEKVLKDADHWCACIFVFTRKAKKYLMVEKSKPIKSHLNRILNLGNIYGYSSQQKGTTETIECISEDQTLVKEIQGVGFFPLKVYLSYCETYQIFVYESYFVIFKLQDNGYMAYLSTVHEKVIEGFFWQKFFIFSTKNQIYFLQITASSKVLMKLADSLPSYSIQKSKQSFESELIDDLEPEMGQMPQGQLQFLNIINLHLLMVNQYEEVVLFPLNTNLYVQFCVELVCGASQKIAQLYKRASAQIRDLMKETLMEYGMSVPQTEAVSSDLIF